MPSTKNCRQYQNLGAITATTGNIVEELDKLKKGIFSKIVVIITDMMALTCLMKVVEY